MNNGKFFDNDDQTDFDYLLVGTGLSARGKSKVLHIDASESYGGNDSSVSHSQFRQLLDGSGWIAKHWVESEFENRATFLLKNDRQFSIDISVPRMLFCESPSVDFLVSQNVSKYLSFLPVKQLLIDEWEFPTSRSMIFADKFLSMLEKRSLMSLFKSVAINSTAVHSTALTSSENYVVTAEWSGSAVEYLKSQFAIERPELVHAIIHGMCMFPFIAEMMDASALQMGLVRFIASLTKFGDGNAVLVPMYGNGDLPQAFARAAAVDSALYILNCPLDQIKPELKPEISIIDMTEMTGSQVPVLHAVAAFQDETVKYASLTILPSNNKPPVFMLTLPNGVAPAGCVVVHFIQMGTANEEYFDNLVEKYLIKKSEYLFASRFHHMTSLNHPFDIEDAMESARVEFNRLRGLNPDMEAPVPACPDPDSP